MVAETTANTNPMGKQCSADSYPNSLSPSGSSGSYKTHSHGAEVMAVEGTQKSWILGPLGDRSGWRRDFRSQRQEEESYKLDCPDLELLPFLSLILGTGHFYLGKVVHICNPRYLGG